MNIFENTKNTKKQGDIGEARAISEYTLMGYTVSVPISDSSKYDLIIEKSGKIKTVQVKTTNQKSKYGIYIVELSTTGGNQSFYTRRKRNLKDYDILFVLSSDNECWSIPSSHFDAKCALNLGNKYDRYKL